MKRRRIIWGAIASIVLIVLFFAPRSSSLMQGSTYSRAPSGYGAWYKSVKARGTAIDRWQKPLEALDNKAPITLLRVSNGTPMSVLSDAWLDGDGQKWLGKGNVLVLLGVRARVTDAPFRSTIGTRSGNVKIETRRRHRSDTSEQNGLLSDANGDVVWGASRGGRIIYGATADLAANAYQDEPGNFEFLTQMLTEIGYPIWVDEYLHGYRDANATAQPGSRSLIRYLAQTPLLLVAVQAGVLLLVLLWGNNQRLGAPRSIVPAAVDNSEAYIQALAGVLLKANCSEFVVEMVGRAEQLQVQRSLGLGTDLLEPAVVLDVWNQRIGQSATELDRVLKLANQPRRLSEAELRTWLDQIQTVRRLLPHQTPVA